ncbi:hypothetical protein B0H17DRAFT_1126989 [Mycena rosella]|uniref:Uncharacterized protein n=1 Tax=Mycena rosella TaxID=1033263 RepID=A0AAD7M6U5_MYCRO|nr:hypothetical protein B0H17DRAFT_1126989 [Mycena rosella]
MYTILKPQADSIIPVAYLASGAIPLGAETCSNRTTHKSPTNLASSSSPQDDVLLKTTSSANCAIGHRTGGQRSSGIFRQRPPIGYASSTIGFKGHTPKSASLCTSTQKEEKVHTKAGRASRRRSARPTVVSSFALSWNLDRVVEPGTRAPGRWRDAKPEETGAYARPRKVPDSGGARTVRASVVEYVAIHVLRGNTRRKAAGSFAVFTKSQASLAGTTTAWSEIDVGGPWHWHRRRRHSAVFLSLRFGLNPYKTSRSKSSRANWDRPICAFRIHTYRGRAGTMFIARRHENLGSLSASKWEDLGTDWSAKGSHQRSWPYAHKPSHIGFFSHDGEPAHKLIPRANGEVNVGQSASAFRSDQAPIGQERGAGDLGPERGDVHQWESPGIGKQLFVNCMVVRVPARGGAADLLAKGREKRREIHRNTQAAAADEGDETTIPASHSLLWRGGSTHAVGPISGTEVRTGFWEGLGDDGNLWLV